MKQTLAAFLTGSLLVLSASGGPLCAQSEDSLRAKYRLPVPPSAGAPISHLTRSSPGMGASSPLAWGANWRDVFVGVAYQARARHHFNPDGSVAAGFGIGNASRWVGLEVVIVELSTIDTGFGTREAVDLKLHRNLPNGFAIAAGWETAFLRGYTDGGSNRYLVVSRWTPLRSDPAQAFSGLVTSVGLGDGRFLKEDDWFRGANKVNLFGSVGLRIFEPVSVIADWYGQDLALAASIAPFRRWRFVVTPGLVDIIGTAGDGARFVASASYSFRF